MRRAGRDITGLLVAWSGGDETAGAHLIEAVYGELRRLARGYQQREGPGHSLPPTALVHEAYLKLVDQRRVLLALDAAQDRLSARSPRQGQLVELRFFGGLTVPEIAAVLGVAPITVKRDWALAKAWLHREVHDVAS